jgi:predicted TIM-barrel fold metal-dependent hydrolase
MPKEIAVIDLMMSIPTDDNTQWYEHLKPLLMDEESREAFRFPAQYMFRDVPKLGRQADYIAYTLEQMDKHNIERAMIWVNDMHSAGQEAARRHPDRFIACYEANPNFGMEEVRRIERFHRELGLKAVSGFASGICPQAPYNANKWYPIYAKLVELGIPFCPCVGVPGPRFPMAPQTVDLLDEVCWFFPELTVVMRHGAEPWQALAIKLMTKYPNLYYMTSAFAPKHYPKEIIEFANTRGREKIMYAGYFPMGLSLDRIFRELPDVPFKDEVWPSFLRENALRVFKLEK